jgi:hypothetical protein
MTNSQLDPVFEQFEKALELTGEHRQQFLVLLEWENPTVAGEVKSLLAQDHPALLSPLHNAAALGITENWPSRVGPYQILGPLAKGGMGLVLRAKDLDFDRLLAVKIVLERFINDDKTKARLVQEARITGRLQHPNIPPECIIAASCPTAGRTSP